MLNKRGGKLFEETIPDIGVYIDVKHSCKRNLRRRSNQWTRGEDLEKWHNNIDDTRVVKRSKKYRNVSSELTFKEEINHLEEAKFSTKSLEDISKIKALCIIPVKDENPLSLSWTTLAWGSDPKEKLLCDWNSVCTSSSRPFLPHSQAFHLITIARVFIYSRFFYIIIATVF